MRILELLEDFFLGFDVALTFAAVGFKNFGLSEFSNLCFVLSGIGLMISFFAMLFKRIFGRGSAKG